MGNKQPTTNTPPPSVHGHHGGPPPTHSVRDYHTDQSNNLNIQPEFIIPTTPGVGMIDATNEFNNKYIRSFIYHDGKVMLNLEKYYKSSAYDSFSGGVFEYYYKSTRADADVLVVLNSNMDLNKIEPPAVNILSVGLQFVKNGKIECDWHANNYMAPQHVDDVEGTTRKILEEIGFVDIPCVRLVFHEK